MREPISKEELVIIVDKANNELFTATRKEMRSKKLIHRATYIIVHNFKRGILIQKRSNSKDIYPGLWEIAAGGVVGKGESYWESAKRELYEETGIKDCTIKEHFDFYFEDETNRVWGRLFSCKFDGDIKDIKSQEEEVDKIKFISLDELFNNFNLEKFTPDSIYLLKKYKKELFDIISA